MQTLYFTDLALKIQNDKDVNGNKIVRLINGLGWTIFCEVIDVYGGTKFDYFICTKTNEKYSIKF